MRKLLALVLLVTIVLSVSFISSAALMPIRNDTVWKDTNGNEITAQGGCIIKEGNTYHWFGPRFGGPGDYKFYEICHYTSTDLSNWTKQPRAFGPGDSGIPFKSGDWVGRPWIFHNSSSSSAKYVMVIEWSYSGDGVRNMYAFLTAPSLNGPWTYRPDKLIKKMKDAQGNEYTLGDLGGYQEGNTGYLLYTFDKPETNYAQAIIKLDSDFMTPLPPTPGNYVEFSGGTWPAGVQEAAAIFKRGSTYYYFTSKCNGWESSETRYRTATNIMGPWSDNQIVPASPSSGNSFNTQHDFVLTVNGTQGTTYIYCGDRWSNFHGQGTGRNAWFPLTFDSNGVPTINGHKIWYIDTVTGLWSTSGGPTPTPPPGGNLVTNAGFEQSSPTQTPPGWSTGGSTPSADYTETGGRNGTYRLTHYRSSSFTVSTYQTITGIPNGTYTLKAWVRSGGGQTSCYMYASNYGGTERKVNIPSNTNWNQITISNIQVTNGQCQIGFYTDSPGGTWCSMDDVEFYKTN